MKKRVESRVTAQLQALVIARLFGFEQHSVSLLPALHFLAESRWVSHLVPPSLSLPICKLGLTVPVPPTLQRNEVMQMSGLGKLPSRTQCGFQGWLRERWCYWEGRSENILLPTVI